MSLVSLVLDLTRPNEIAYRRFCFGKHARTDAVRRRRITTLPAPKAA